MYQRLLLSLTSVLLYSILLVMPLNTLQFVQVCLVFLLSLAHGLQQREVKSTAGPSYPKTVTKEPNHKALDLLNKDKKLSPAEVDNKNDDNGLIEVKEDEIPEGSMVYVLEEPKDQPVDGEILKTANNIVFRPLFRYRGKQEALRRNSNSRIRRRYFIPKRSYRQTYRYPYFYNYRYY